MSSVAKDSVGEESIGDEVQSAVKFMYPMKCPGSDSIQSAYFQIFGVLWGSQIPIWCSLVLRMGLLHSP